MQLKLGDPVRSQDGKDLGVIKYLILDPSTATVNTFVVERGWLLPEDIEVPLEGVQETENRSIQVAYTAAQAAQLPRFDESLYIPFPSELTQPFLTYPFGGILWPHGDASPMMAPSGLMPPLNVSDTEGLDTDGFDAAEAPRPVPEESEEAELLKQKAQNCAVIAAGDDVLSSDGEKIGEVQSVTFDSDTGRPTRLVVRHGKLFFEDKELPAESIASVHDGAVYLRLSKERMRAV